MRTDSRCGVDVASDGGDEVAIAPRMVGDVTESRYSASGAINDSQVKVAERVLEEIHQAQRLADRLGSPHAVRTTGSNTGPA
ncbi:hypothetical protein [Streptomyces sp. NPDC048192]|uniref:hypothetical protein n=1 Tax=Streptomyces sp. NPDC048192 TaxID=3365510 RepID=UPI00371D540F